MSLVEFLTQSRACSQSQAAWGRWSPLSSLPHPMHHQSTETEPDLVRSLLEEARAKQKALARSGVGEAMRQWPSPPQAGAGAQPAGRGNPLSSAPIPPPRFHRTSSRKDPSYPRPTEPSLQMAGSKCQPGTPAASLCLADSPGQHRTMPPGPASRANVSGFCFLTVPGNGTERA